ncbi:MAG: energy transducer TonB [Bacteroidetes bacterium]|nr:MAG: energy transducer TonB [Bacteroidota bacterium]
MKKLLLVVLLLIPAIAFSQDEWGSVNKTTVILKEIAPVWPGCEGKTGVAINDCFKQKLAQHLGKNFKYPAEAYKRNEQGKVIVEIIINELGKVEIESITGGTKLLRDAARKNVSSIPTMARPGLLGGEPMALNYTIPLIFKTGK